MLKSFEEPKFDKPDDNGSKKPEKADLADDTIDDVPESVKGGKEKEEKSDIEKLKDQESYEEVYEVDIDGETYEIPVQVSYFEYPEHIQEDTGGVLGYKRKQIDWRLFAQKIPGLEYSNEPGKGKEVVERLKSRIYQLQNKISKANSELEEVEMEDTKSEEVARLEKVFESLGRNLGKIDKPTELKKKAKNKLAQEDRQNIEEWPFNRLGDFRQHLNRLVKILQDLDIDFEDPRKPGISIADDYGFLMNKANELLEKAQKAAKDHDKRSENQEEKIKDRLANLESQKKEAEVELDDAEGDWDLSGPESKDKVWQLIEKITHDNFPSKTCNHVITRDKYEKMGREEGFGAKKISDPQSFAKLLREANKYGEDNFPMTIYNQPRIVDINSQKIESLTSEVPNTEDKVEKKIKKIERVNEDKSACIVGRAGLSASSKGRFHFMAKKSVQSMTYGFSNKNSAFKNYLKKVKEHKILPLSYEGDPLATPKPQQKTIEYFLDDMPSYPERFHSDGERNHPWIPVVHGHPDIPDLRWCHAEYGYIPTEKNLNVVRFISEDFEDENESEDTGSDDI